MVRKRVLNLVTFGLPAAMLMLAGGFFVMRETAPTELPITAMPDGVYRISPDDYDERALAQLQRTEAVFVPVDSAGDVREPFAPPTDFVGSPVCRECHADYVDSAAATAHARTLRLPAPDTILGSIAERSAEVSTRSRNFSFEIERRSDGFYEKLIVNRAGRRYLHSERIDYSVGSGKLGQTFLYWKGDALYELPVSYFTESGKWVNSPGYLDGTANFARPVIPGCVQCHTTWMQHIPNSLNRYRAEGAVLGVTCERCHGPGRKHVDQRRRSASNTTTPDAIINPAGLSRESQLELCSQCHSGVGEQLRPPFSYRPGEPLAEHIRIAAGGKAEGVHSANQRARLALSRCYQKSDMMTCTTCHDPHQHERGNGPLFASRCLECHAAKDCQVVQVQGARLEARCVECHMPLEQDTETRMHTSEGIVLPLLRDHHIRIDYGAMERVLNTRQ